MRAASKSRGMSPILIRPALWFCACHLLAAALTAQCTNPAQVPNGIYTSGDHSATDNNALSASNLVISGGATATLVAGNCIQLLPGFHASAMGATVATTFHAWVETAPAAVSVSPESGGGQSKAFTWTVSSPSGFGNIKDVFAIFNTSASGANACYIHYDRASNQLSVADSSGANWSTGITPGEKRTTDNFSPNCTLNGDGSSVHTSGTELAVTASVAFQPSFSGDKNRYLIAYDNAGLNSEWQQFGTWKTSDPAGFTPIRISSGGAYTDTLGQVWSADNAYYLQGTPWYTGSPVSGTPDQKLYQNETFNYPGNLTYQFGVPNGNYTVTLKFAEIFEDTAGQRPMNVALNGTLVVTGLDVWTAAGGKNRAYDRSFPVSVSGGQLTITLSCTNSGHSAEVNAIQIVAGTAPPEPDFGITIPNSDQPIPVSYTGANFLVTILPAPGFTGPVSISWSSSPALSSDRVRLSATSLPSSASWSTSMLVWPPSNVSSGSWDVTVTAANSAHIHTAVAHVSLTAQPDFRIIVTPPATPITAGQSGVYTVSIGAVNGLDSGTSVNLSISSLPSGATAAPASVTLPADGSTRAFTVFTSTSTISGAFYVYGTGGGKSHGAWQSLNMQTNPVGTYTISGQVQQPNGAGIGGTNFEVRNSQNAVVASAGSDDHGNYSISLASGQYTITASSPYGHFSPASAVYDLTGPTGLSGQHRRLTTMIASPDPDPPESAPRHPVKVAIGSATTTLWYFPGEQMDARNIQNPPGCWASPGDNVTTTVTLPTQPSRYYTVVFAVDANATPGAREFYCHYRGRIDGRDVDVDLDGQDFLVLEPRITALSMTVANSIDKGATTKTSALAIPADALQWPSCPTQPCAEQRDLWTNANLAVLVRGSVPSVTLIATTSATSPYVKIAFSIARAPDDAAGSAKPTLVANGSGTATLSLDQTGSFQVLAYIDTNQNGQWDPGETGLTMPVILVKATLNQNLSKIPHPDYILYNKVSVEGDPWGQSVVQAGFTAGCSAGSSDDCAVILSAEVDLIGGGQDGRRGVDQVFGGWAQDLGTLAGLGGGYQNNHLDTEVFASNVPPPPHDPSTFYPQGAYSPLGADPDPQIIAGPLLDSIGSSPGTGGNSSLVASSAYQDAATSPRLGKRKLITAFDAPRQGFLAKHPIDMVSQLTQIQHNLPFNSFLTLWTSVGGVVDPNDTTHTPPPGVSGTVIADRTYGVILGQPWNIGSVISVDAAGNGTLGAGVFIYLGTPSCASPGCTVSPLADTAAVLTAPMQCKGPGGPTSPCTAQNARGSNYKH
jgi:hypothetical protein